jgi:ABC-2 type transport system permease protein
MLKDLMRKELRLNWHPALSAFMLLASLLLIPQWVYYIAFIYIFILVMVVVQTDKANNDLIFTTLLPVRKKDVVTARTLVIVGWQLLYIALAAACAAIRLRFYPVNNGTSMNSNLAFFGSAFLMFGIFNAIFIAGTYKTPYRMVWPLLGGSVIAVSVGAILDTLPLFIPAVSRLFNDNGLGHLPYQLAALLFGIAVFAGATVWAAKKGAANLERVDL